MIRKDYHVHTTYCDGKAKAEDMVLAAISQGLLEIGFSGHAYMNESETWCMTREGTKQYVEEIRFLAKKYKDKIKILLGTEQDYYSVGDFSGYDYKIGSVHCVEINGNLFAVDDTAEIQKATAEKYFGGDLMCLAELYYQTEAKVLEKTGADIIGHFNVLEKFNENDGMYDTSSERYRKAWQAAADELLKYGKPFEINTGAISRGYRTEPYPSVEMMDYIAARGGSFILSSDSHNTDTLLYEFEKWEKFAKEKGYKLII